MAALPNWNGRHARRRRLIQLGFLLVFALLPAFDLFRFDFSVNRLYAFGRVLWLDEWALIWLGLMAAMWVVGAIALILGRVFCGYACPQTIFSEIAHDLDALAARAVRPLPRARREHFARALSLLLVTALSALATAVFLGYFAPLPEVFRRLARFDVSPWVGAIGLLTTLLGVLNLGFIREKFCTSVCPYGLLQGVLEDNRSFHVALDESTGPCIQCSACARVCPMEIDIRNGSFQIQCTRCGACVDACEGVMAKQRPLPAPDAIALPAAPRGRPPVLFFRFPSNSRTWDLKRVLVAVASAGFVVAFIVALAARQPVRFQLSPLYTTEVATAGPIAETRFLLRASNRGKEPVTLRVGAEGLPEGATLGDLGNAEIPAGEERRFTLVVRIVRAEAKESVTPFVFRVEAADRLERFPAAAFVGSRRRT